MFKLEWDWNHKARKKTRKVPPSDCWKHHGSMFRVIGWGEKRKAKVPKKSSVSSWGRVETDGLSRSRYVEVYSEVRRFKSPWHCSFVSGVFFISNLLLEGFHAEGAWTPQVQELEHAAMHLLDTDQRDEWICHFPKEIIWVNYTGPTNCNI